jgi:DNA-binding Xre family transcriptional regulator
MAANQKKTLISLANVSKIKWDKKKGSLLYLLRGDIPRTVVARQTGISDQQIKWFELGRNKGIDPNDLIKICQAINADICDFIPTYDANDYSSKEYKD